MTTSSMPLHFRSLEIKNHVFRASRSWAPDWELRFAEAGVGAIISPCVPVHLDGPPEEPMDSWPEHFARVQAHGCKYLVRLGQPPSYHRALSGRDLQDIACSFAQAARLAREAGADGLEIDGGHDSLIAQFLGSGTSGRPAAYQGSLEHRARLAREIIRAVRGAVGPRFHVQVRLGVSSPMGVVVAGTLQVIHWLEADGIDAIHLAPIDGDHSTSHSEGALAMACRFVKDAAQVPVLRNGRFQTQQAIQSALEGGSSDAVALARPLPALRQAEGRLRPAA